jgi:hypothetical protein
MGSVGRAERARSRSSRARSGDLPRARSRSSRARSGDLPRARSRSSRARSGDLPRARSRSSRGRSRHDFVCPDRSRSRRGRSKPPTAAPSGTCPASRPAAGEEGPLHYPSLGHYSHPSFSGWARNLNNPRCLLVLTPFPYRFQIGQWSGARHRVARGGRRSSGDWIHNVSRSTGT